MPSRRVHDSGYYDANDIELRSGRTVAALDVGAHEVELDDGERRSTAPCWRRVRRAPPRHPGRRSTASTTSAPSTTRSGSVRRSAGPTTRRDRRRLDRLEVAASARQVGADVVLIDPLAAPLYRVLGPQIADIFADCTPTTGSTCG